MTYPGQFHHLVVIGNLYSEKFNFTLNIVPSAIGELGMPAVNTATITAVAGVVSSWFSTSVGPTGPGISSDAKLTSIKLNRLDINGRYVDSDAQEFIYPSPISGIGSSGIVPQNTLVHTLGTRLDRGRGSKGRVYLPPQGYVAGVTPADGRISAGNAAQSAAAFAVFIRNLNNQYLLIGKVGVASKVGAGVFEHVTRVSVGRVVDTMRSRRSSLAEDRQEVVV